MPLIEQAVFTSAETDRSAGYQVVGTSAGVDPGDARELAAWCPSHDAFLQTGPAAASINFHPLPSGAWCVSRTVPAGWEYSGRSGPRVYTQCLIVPPDVLARFANNPFALLRAAVSQGAVRVYDAVPGALPALELPGRAAVVDTSILARLAVNPGPDWMAALLQAALDSVSLAVVGGPPAEQVIAGLINCLPPECRTEISFSTGLKFSPRRPFRVVAISGDQAEQQRFQRVYNLTVIRLASPMPGDFAPTAPWPRLIQRVLRLGRGAFLTAALGRRRARFEPDDLSALGLQLLEELEAAALSPTGQAPADLAESESSEIPQVEPGPAPARGPSRPSPSDVARQSHAAHRISQKSGNSPATAKPAGPSRSLPRCDPKMLENFERLDDLVYEAMAGGEAALDSLRKSWPLLRQELDAELLLESREQYLRYALKIWEEAGQSDGPRDPARAIQALGVLSLLFAE